MSSSHFWLANSAVQITSEQKTSHSPDLASWRWMNWLRCSSADAGNSSSLAFRPSALNFALNSLTAAVWSPDVSLPRQKVTLPLAACDASSVGAFATPLVTPVASCVAEPPPPPPPLLSLSSLPHATTNSASETTNAAANLLRAPIERTLLLNLLYLAGPLPTSDPTGQSLAEYPRHRRANQAAATHPTRRVAAAAIDGQTV